MEMSSGKTVSKGLQNKIVSKEHHNKTDIAGVMGEVAGQTLPESEDYHKFIRSISLPRDEEYVQLIAKQIELLNREEELLAELEEMKAEQDTQPEDKMPEAAGLEDLPGENADAKKQETVEQKTAQTAKETKVPSKEEIRKKEIEAELKRLDEEIAFLNKNLETMFPESKRRLTMIYPSIREGDLIRAGVIEGLGRAYAGGEELCARIKPMTARERAMLILGDRILTDEIEQVLNIEIYPEAVCVVYPNGLTKVYR